MKSVEKCTKISILFNGIHGVTPLVAKKKCNCLKVCEKTKLLLTSDILSIWDQTSMSFLAAKRMQGEGAFIVKAVQEVRTVAQVCSRFWETSVVNNPDVLW